MTDPNRTRPAPATSNDGEHGAPEPASRFPFSVEEAGRCFRAAYAAIGSDLAAVRAFDGEEDYGVTREDLFEIIIDLDAWREHGNPSRRFERAFAAWISDSSVPWDEVRALAPLVLKYDRYE